MGDAANIAPSEHFPNSRNLLFRRTRHVGKLHSQTKHFSTNGNESQNCQRKPYFKLRPDSGLLSQKLRQSQLSRSADSTRMHETIAPVHKLPVEVGRPGGRPRRRVWRQGLLDVGRLLHGLGDLGGLFLSQIIPHSWLKGRRNAKVWILGYPNLTPFKISV